MMEGIVYGIANINFQQNLVEFRDENRTPNYIPMASPAENFPQSHEGTTENTRHIGASSSPSDESVNDNSWEETGDTYDNTEGGASNTRRNKGLTFLERRQLPSRISKENSLVGTKRRTIMKPKKSISPVHKDFGSLKPAEIKKIYMRKKLTKFRPASLETIIEESPNSQSSIDEEDHNNQVTFLGTRKLRRVVVFNDCLFVNKALIKKRRAKIKKNIGRRPALKKISLEEFMDKLNSSMEEKQARKNPSEDMDEGYCHTETSLNNSIIQESINCSLASARNGVVTEETMELPSAATHEVV